MALDKTAVIIIIKTMKNNIDGLTFHSYGRSRGRIVLVHSIDSTAISPGKIQGSRWIVFGNALYDLNVLVSRNSYLRLNTAVPGGMTSGTWQTLRHNPAVDYPDPIAVAGTKLKIWNFGAGSSRVVLVGHTTDFALHPSRLGTTSFIALNAAAHVEFRKWFHTLPGDSRKTIPAFHDASIPLGGGTLNLLRAALP